MILLYLALMMGQQQITPPWEPGDCVLARSITRSEADANGWPPDCAHKPKPVPASHPEHKDGWTHVHGQSYDSFSTNVCDNPPCNPERKTLTCDGVGCGPVNLSHPPSEYPVTEKDLGKWISEHCRIVNVPAGGWTLKIDRDSTTLRIECGSKEKP